MIVRIIATQPFWKTLSKQRLFLIIWTMVSLQRLVEEQTHTKLSWAESFRTGTFLTFSPLLSSSITRAAMKTANLDKIFDWKLSQEFDETNRLAKNPIAPDVEPLNATRDEEIFYFADVCAGNLNDQSSPYDLI